MNTIQKMWIKFSTEYSKNNIKYKSQGNNMGIMIKKRNGRKEVLDITKIQKMTIESTFDLEGVSQSELELDAQIKFVDGMSSSDIQDALIKTAVEKIDIDVPNWTFVAARLFVFDLYHRVGKATHGIKGEPYCHLKDYLK